MRNSQEVGAIVLQEKRPERRILVFAGLLAEALGRTGVIVVGGSAIEILTAGGYVSGDVDLVVESPEEAKRILEAWGFDKGGRLWARPDWDLYIDIVGRAYTGSTARTREVKTPFGSVRIAGVEDCLVKRLASAKHWRIPQDLDHAEMLLRQYRESIDWDYLRDRAKYYDVTEVLADLEKLVQTKSRARRRRSKP
jgi:hypothetical protein